MAEYVKSLALKYPRVNFILRPILWDYKNKHHKQETLITLGQVSPGSEGILDTIAPAQAFMDRGYETPFNTNPYGDVSEFINYQIGVVMGAG